MLAPSTRRQRYRTVTLAVTTTAQHLGDVASLVAVFLMRSPLPRPAGAHAAGPGRLPRVTTGRIGVLLLAVSIPIVCVSVVVLRKWWGLRESGLLGVLAFFVFPYFLLGLQLSRLPCR
jgi:hypothetical protein